MGLLPSGEYVVEHLDAWWSPPAEFGLEISVRSGGHESSPSNGGPGGGSPVAGEASVGVAGGGVSFGPPPAPSGAARRVWTVPGSYLEALLAVERAGEGLDGVREVERGDSELANGLRIVLDLGDAGHRVRGASDRMGCTVRVRDGRLDVLIHEEPLSAEGGPEAATSDVPAAGTVASGTDTPGPGFSAPDPWSVSGSARSEAPADASTSTAGPGMTVRPPSDAGFENSVSPASEGEGVDGG